jgi:release factor glutamine methyltransferase
MLLERPEAKAVMVEKNPRSLQWAWKNVERYGLHERALLWHSRSPEDIPEGGVDLVVGNPPYIPTKDIRNLMREVRDHEPHLALDGGEDGMDFYRMFFQNAGAWLKPGGALVFEIGDATQAKNLRSAAPSYLNLAKEVPDYAGIPRCMAWKFHL